jgi:hypothetical protein
MTSASFCSNVTVGFRQGPLRDALMQCEVHVTLQVVLAVTAAV